MSTEPESPPPEQGPSQPETRPAAQDDGTKGDLMALGIGCGVFMLMLIAIVLVGMSGR
jgi:hypothetical protein